MSVRVRKKQVAFGAVLLAGITFLVALCFVLSPDVRILSIAPLEWLGADNSLAALADDTDKDVRASALNALVRRGSGAVPALTHRLDRKEVSDRITAVFILGQMGPAARDALPALKRRLWEDDSEQVRAAVTRALDQIAGDDADTIAQFVRLLETGTDSDRSLAAGLLREHGDRASEIVPALAKALRDRSPRVRQEAAEALEGIGPKAKQAIPALVEATRDSDRGVRKEAAEALERIITGLGDGDAALRELGRVALERAKAEEAGGHPKAP